MFDHDEITRVVALQEKSYGLLTWVNASIKAGTLRFDVMHQALTASQAAEEWIGRHLANIPPTTRPTPEDLPTFASLFASFLMASFELEKSPRTILTSYCGCFCSWCTFLAAGSHLKTKKITKSARQKAKNLKLNLLEELAVENDLDYETDVLSKFAHNKHFRTDVSLITYADELLRRNRSLSHGDAALVLWREIAWADNKRPKKKFRLSANEILAAETRVIHGLKTTPPQLD